MTEFIFILFGLLILSVGFCLGILFEQGMSRRDFDDRLQESTEWCAKHCKDWERCFSNHDDPYDALKELTDECDGCLFADLVCYHDCGGGKD